MRTRHTRGSCARWGLAGLAALIVSLTTVETSAQTHFIPYYGKNKIRYDKFNWQIYTTDHFEIYYYPEVERHLERIAAYAESAYQQISADLKHDLAIKVPLVIFKTHSEFEQQNVSPEEISEGVAAFAEPQRDRMVLPIDEPPDRLYGLIVHELTHIFEFDIIPRSLIRRSVPLWVDEGLSDYMRAAWEPLDLMFVRDAAVADIIPKMSEMEGYGTFNNPRLVYDLGHAAFEFIESRWGKEGIRQFLFSLRKSVIGGGDSAYEEAFRLKAEDFDEQFEKYIKDRFKPFRDKERPADYGKNLAPRPDKTKFPAIYSIESSPSGDLIAAAAGNRKDRELDIILISSKDGQVIRNLTSGFDKDRGFEYISTPSGRWNQVPWMSWSPVGDRIAYFVRTEKVKTLILQNVISRKIEQRIEMKTLDEPESPDIASGGRIVAFSALRGGIGDIYTVNLDTSEVANLTNDDFADYAPTFSPDGKSIIYMARISGNNKLFRLDLATKQKTQLTFGTHDDAAVQFLDNETIIFPSTATDPSQPVDPDVAKNGNIFNLWSLSLKTGELRQWTDALGGNVSPIVLKEKENDPGRIAFVTYFKGEHGLHTLNRKEPITTAASSDFGAPGPIIDFQAPLSHTLVQANSRKKGMFEKLFLEGRPPVNVGVTSGGDFFGGSQVTFTDVLGDQQFNLFAASISQYRTLSFSYVNLARRLQYAAQGFSQTVFFYGFEPGLLFDPGFAFIDRDLALATRTIRGGSIFGIYPFNRYARVELSGGFLQYKEQYNNPDLAFLASEFQQQELGTQIFRDGSFVPLSVAFVQETTVFREYGPLAGNTIRFAYENAPKIGNTLSRQTLDLDARYYLRLGTNGVFAVRARGFNSWGEFPDFLFFGGNSEMRGYRYLEFLGHKAFFTNAELRFPIIEAALTPIGVVGGVRGVFFANFGGAGFQGQPFKVWDKRDFNYEPIIGFRQDPRTGDILPVTGPRETVSGFRLVDSRASYGIGLETFALGFPIHFDFSWRTMFNKQWEDLVFSLEGGSSSFRRRRFDVWIGYDF
jgi:hypothetical protein